MQKIFNLKLLDGSRNLFDSCCSKEGEFYVYYIKIVTNKGTVYKVGRSENVEGRIKWLISTERPKSEVKGLGIIVESCKILGVSSYDNKAASVKVEARIHRMFRNYRYTGIKVLASGNCELYSKDILGIDT